MIVAVSKRGRSSKFPVNICSIIVCALASAGGL